MRRELQDCITDVDGVTVGHAQDLRGQTGCTVLLFERGAIAGVDIGGTAPGTRETELLNPTNMIMKIHAVMLAGGSTFGLSTASGAQHFLQERGIGFRASTGVVVPIVPTAVIFDLDIGKPQRYPGKTMGLEACYAATSAPSPQGAVGAGTGATCGKVLGTEHAMRGGVGTASLKLEGGVVVGVLCVSNPWGDVIDPVTGAIVAGARDPQRPDAFLDTEAHIVSRERIETSFFGMDTTLCVVATDARLTREQVTKVAMMAQDGIARAVRPSHTLFDGDIVFALSTGGAAREADVSIVGAVAARLVARAIVRGVAEANRAVPTSGTT